MGCGCREEKKQNRYEPEKATTPQVRTGAQTGNQSLLKSVQWAQQASYEELMERQEAQNKMLREMEESHIAGMTDAMKRAYVEQFVAIANNEAISPIGVSPEQAVRTLFEVLPRPEFKAVTDLYPELLPQVEKRFNEIKEKHIQLK